MQIRSAWYNKTTSMAALPESKSGQGRLLFGKWRDIGGKNGARNEDEWRKDYRDDG